MELDRYCLQILAELQRDARQTVQQLSAAVGLSPTPCWKRVKDLEAAGVIRGYTALLDPELLGLDVTAFVAVFCYLAYTELWLLPIIGAYVVVTIWLMLGFQGKIEPLRKYRTKLFE